jgi:CheY-like chemotaxis protein
MAATLLVVEDNPVTRKLVVSVLRREGYRVVEAEDGATALDLAGTQAPDLALVDIMLPDADGWDIAAQLHDRRDVSPMPLLAFTGCLSKVDEGRLANSPFTDVVTKPVDVAQLLATVRTHLPAQAGSQESPLTGRRLVVADDDTMQLKLLTFHLRRLGCEVESAADGAAALELAQRTRPDAIVSDVMMPKLDGYGLCMAARHDPTLRDVPIVLTTNTFLESSDKELGMRAGADAFVTRTPQLTELLQTLESVLARQRAPRTVQYSLELSRDHASRILQQLERQVSRNSRLSQHCAILSAELSVLRSISQALAQSEDLESALTSALVACFDAGGVATGAVVLSEPDGGVRIWSPPGAGDAFALAFQAPEQMALLHSFISRRSTTALSIETVAAAPERELLEREGFESLVVVPLIQGATVLGALVMASKSAGLVERERVLFAEAIANQIAVALTVKHAFETLEHRVAERTAQLQQARDEAERANRAKTSFLSAVSHDLRTPLNAILGFAQLLDLDELAPEQADSVRQILSGGGHLLDLINEVLDISRIESGYLHLTIEPTDPDAVIDDAIELIRPLASQRRLTVTIERGDARVPIKADRQRLKQVLLNLLSNAVKYNREGGSIVVSRSERDGTCRIAVTDTGHGIAKAKQALLFTPFQRLGAELTGVEGTGLGLSLAHALAERMGGSLGVESREREGSTFWIDLPIAEGVDVGERRPRETGRTAATPEGVGTVLYVEDNMANLRLMERMLARRRGVNLVHATTGAAALALVHAHPPDLILLDVQLPDMSGADVLAELKRRPEVQSVPVVVLTADAAPELPGRFVAAGAAAFLTKPLDVRQMLGVVDSCLAIAR